MIIPMYAILICMQYNLPPLHYITINLLNNLCINTSPITISSCPLPLSPINDITLPIIIGPFNDIISLSPNSDIFLPNILGTR